MERLMHMLSRVRLVYTRSRVLTKSLVLVALVLSVTALLLLHSAILNGRAQTEALRNQAAQLEQENNRLEQSIDSLGSIDGIKDIARDELGYVDPDTVVLQPGN